MKKVIISLLLAISGTLSASEIPNFSIESENDPSSEQFSSRLSLERERELLQNGMEKLYPLLPKHIQEVAKKTTIVVNHKWRPVTSTYHGFSAEDDPEYFFPNTDFYNKKSNNKPGLIKANVTEKFMLLIDFGTRMFEAETEPEKKALYKEGTESIFNNLLAHELAHAYQYSVKPAQKIRGADPKYFDNGLVDPLLVEAASLVVKYEVEATDFDLQYLKPDGLRALGEKLLDYEDKNPELFSEGAKYHYISKHRPKNPTARHYLIRNADNAEKQSSKFSASQDKTYNGQFVPLRLLQELVDINTSIKEENKAKIAYQERVKEIESEWTFYINDGADSVELQKVYEYLVPAKERFELELKQFKSIL